MSQIIVCTCYAYSEPHNNFIHTMYKLKLGLSVLLVLASSISMIISIVPGSVASLLSLIYYSSQIPTDGKIVPEPYRVSS